MTEQELQQMGDENVQEPFVPLRQSPVPASKQHLPEWWEDNPSVPLRQSPVPTRAAVKRLSDWVILVAVSLVLALLLKTYVVQAFYIPSGSMLPTLEIGDRLLVSKVGYRFGDVNRGDIVVFHKPDPYHNINDLIKRVIAVGGDTFELKEGDVHINGELLDEPYIHNRGTTFPKAQIQGCKNEATARLCEVPEGMLLVLGDNREASRDSRYFGVIPEETVVGRAVVTVWPFSNIGSL